MKEIKSKPPSTSEQFNKVYSSPIASWVWGDIRFPKEINELVKTNNPKTSLELGCGLGRFSNFLAKHGIKATGVDFSSVADLRSPGMVVTPPGGHPSQWY